MQLSTGKTAGQRDALQVQRDLKQRLDQIRSDTKLSEAGKREAIAREWWNSRKTIKSLEAGELSSINRGREDLYTRLFGADGFQTGTDIISQRDAADRAARISSPEEAQALLDAARRTGDSTLGKAIAARAYSERWIGTLEHWAGGDATVEQSVTTLYEMDARGTNGTKGVAQLLEHGMAFDVGKPREIADLPGSLLDSMIGESTTDYGESAVERSAFGHSTTANDYALNSPQVEAAVSGASE